MLSKYRSELDKRKGQRDQISQSLSTAKSKCRVLNRELKQFEEAQVIIQTVAQQTQEELEYHISEIVTLALASVFDEPYEFKIEFTIKRGKTEADLWFVRDGEKIKPFDASGGGAVDIAAFALRIALWNLKAPKSRNVLILDEPGKMISADLRDKFSQMIKELSDKLKIQIIMVTHAEELIEHADKVFRININQGKSKIS